ncbi:hypothetical protein [Mucilaginibacter sp.]
MNLNINRVKFIISTVAAFFICCSMNANCNTPGPATEIHGIVTDGITGKPIGNLPMRVGNYTYDPHYFNTNADGSYDFKFNPERLYSYYLTIAPSTVNNYLPSIYTDNIQKTDVTQGTDNLINYKAYPAINVTVHLINHSDYGQNGFQLTILDSLGINNGYLNLLYPNNHNLLLDTIAKYQMAHYSHVSFDSFFISSAGVTAKDLKQAYILGNKDTLINITNP